MSPILIYLVAGARPNFMKIAPIARALEKTAEKFTYRIVHTGQHYDREMSQVFFEELGIPEPHHNLECGGGSHAEQTAKIMVAFERVCASQRPDCVVVVGDVNSTLACSIASKKLHIPVAHVEAGLRSGDRSMPEEINRIVTDSISDWFFCTEPAGVNNLLAEGKPSESVFHVGHVMVDNLLYQRNRLSDTALSIETHVCKRRHESYGVVTLHRPSNVDDAKTLSGIFRALNAIAEKLPLIFPVHPRTRSNMDKFGIAINANIELTAPMSYMKFLDLWKGAALVLTDSGGLQEETTALDVPCLTLRKNTERPITVTQGTNSVVGTNADAIIAEAARILSGKGKAGRRPELWDGCSAERIVSQLEVLLCKNRQPRNTNTR